MGLSSLSMLIAAAGAAAVLGCSSSGSTPFVDGGPDGMTQEDVSTGDSPGNDPTGCMKAGGQCGCAGGCNPGSHPAPAPLLYQCPQPCDQCGACSQQCCLPDEPTDAGNDAGCEGTISCLCGAPKCVGGQWQCGTCEG